jgi:hypothetical protein
MLNVGHLAKTFSMLPSQVVKQATTYDLMIADVMSTWEDYQIRKSGGKPVVPDLTTDELLELVKNNKGKKTNE